MRVLIVDHIRLTGEMFATVLAEQPDIEVIGCCTTGKQALAQLQRSEILLVSTNLPAEGAYWLVHRVSRAKLGVRTLVVGLDEGSEKIIRYLEAGALGYICREDTVDDLIDNLRSINRGETILSPALAAGVVTRLAELASCIEEIAPLPEVITCLTPREREILTLIRRDYSNQDIADQLIIELGTVKNHVHNILTKLNVNSRREAANILPVLSHPVEVERFKRLHWMLASNQQVSPS
jgi:DNA-binding NarL/FixJ family response regulator